MRTVMLSVLVLLLTGCAYHPVPASVYGQSGTAYQAPTLCGALTKCLNGSETACYYEKVTYLSPVTGVVESGGCAVVAK